MFFFLFSLLFLRNTDLPEPTATARPTETPWATAKSGSPKTAVIWGSAVGAVSIIAASVSILCFKKDKNNGFTSTAQILLEKNDF